MSEQTFQLVKGIGFVVAAALALALERLVPHARVRERRWGVNLGLWAIDVTVIGGLCGTCACTVARGAAARGVGLLHVLAVPAWIGLPLTIVGLDLVSYCWHRANHRLRFLWRFHRVHHSDPGFSVSTAIRFHPGELLLSLPIRLGAVAALGAPALAVVVFEVVFTVANLVEHGDIDLPLGLERRLARVCVTPALHRLHHARHAPDRNFGTVFSVWDRLLGSYAPSSSAARVETGLLGLDAPLALRAAMLLPLRKTA